MLQEGLDISAIFDIEGSGHLAVYSVIHHDIQDAPAQIDDSGQLFFRTLFIMAYLEETHGFRRCIQKIAPGGGQDRMAFRAQQGDILHDHLTADPKGTAQCASGKWRGRSFYQC